MPSKPLMFLLALITPLLIAPFGATAGAATEDLVVDRATAATAAVTYRNPGALWHHSLSLEAPREVPICSGCEATDQLIPLGDFDAGQQLRLRFTVTRHDGSTIVYYSDQPDHVSVVATADGWELSWEDGGGAPADLVVQIRLGAAAPAPPRFTKAAPDVTIYPPLTGTRTLTFAAADPDGQKTEIGWDALAPGLACALGGTATAPEIRCELERTSSRSINTTTFTARDADGNTATTTLRIGVLRHVAMGDSYHSGEGAPPFDIQTDGRSNWCHRSLAAAAVQLAARPADDIPSLPLTHVACTGAKLANLYTGQDGESPQLDALGPDVGLVTISIGGNDVGFAPVLKACVLQRGCSTFLKKPVEQRLVWLDRSNPDYGGYTPLEGTFRLIREKAPNATVLVLGYPRLFQLGGSLTICEGVSRFDQQWVNKVTIAGNDVIRRAAARAGAKYVDMVQAYNGRSLCDDGSYINGIVRQPYHHGWQNSFHPNARGQAVMADTMRAALG